MATDPGLIEHLCDQLEGLGVVRTRKMFGEYMIYCNDKPVLIVCDDRPMVKILPILEPLLQDHPTAPPYEGAKDHYVLDPDDRETLRQAVRLAEEVTPLPKKKGAKKKEPSPGGEFSSWDMVWPQQAKPALSDIEAWVRNPLLGEFMAWIEKTYDVEPSVEFSKCSLDRGWNIKYKKGSKSLCVIYVRSGWFAVMVTLGAKQLAELEPLLPTYSAAFQEIYENTALFRGGKWLLVDIKKPAQMEEVRRLIRLKTGPGKSGA